MAVHRVRPRRVRPRRVLRHRVLRLHRVLVEEAEQVEQAGRAELVERVAADVIEA